MLVMKNNTAVTIVPVKYNFFCSPAASVQLTSAQSPAQSPFTILQENKRDKGDGNDDVCGE